jgi:16S rRNA (guanine1207-N2)-methyltransferase
LRPAPFCLDDQRRQWQHDGLQIVSYPSVFSHGRLDQGTELLLQVLAQQQLSGTALDIGCGAGIISATLARAGVTVTASDISATALVATKETLAANDLSAQLLAGDVYAPVTGRFDLIVTNPPFHEGLQRTTSISERLIMQAPKHLNERGRLLLVANQGLPYGEWLKKAFRQVDIVAENRQFRVWQGRR